MNCVQLRVNGSAGTLGCGTGREKRAGVEIAGHGRGDVVFSLVERRLGLQRGDMCVCLG